MEEKKSPSQEETQAEVLQAYKRKSLIGIYEDYVAVCISTTGMNPRKNTLIEIGAVKVAGGAVVDKFDALINPRHRLDDQTIKLTGITNSMLRDAEGIEVILPKFDVFLDDSILLGNYLAFDIGFFVESYQRVLKKPFPNSYIDTLKVSKELYPMYKNHRLDDLKKRYRIPERDEYPAVNDAMDTHLCYQCMIMDMKEDEKKKK